MKLQSKTTGDVVTVYMESGGGLELLPKIELAISGGVHGVVLNMAGVDKIRSDDLEYMVKGRCFTERHSGVLVLCEVGERLLRALAKVSLEGFFMIFRNEESAIQYAQERLCEGVCASCSDEEMDEIEHETIRTLRKSTRVISARKERPSVQIRVPEMAIKVFTKKCIRDLFYIDLLCLFLGKEGALLTGKEIAEEFGIEEGVIKTALEDMAASGIIGKSSSGFFGKATYCLNLSDEQKTCIEDLKSVMKTPGGKGRILSWMKG